MTGLDPVTAMRFELFDNPPLPTDGQVIREAMSRILPILASDLTYHWRKCPWRPCRRERCCMAPLKECAASPRAPVANIETTHAWLAKRLREELLDILLERVLGAEEDGEAPNSLRPHPEEPAEGGRLEGRGRPHPSRRIASR